MAINSRDVQEYFHRLMANARDPREAQEIMRECSRTLEREMMYGIPQLPSPLYPANPYIGMALGEKVKPTPTKPLPEEHLVSAVIGFRAWNVPLFVDELRSVAKTSKWLPYQRFEAKCENSQCQGVQCSCGIYAFNKMDLVQKEYRSDDRSKRYVYGECWLWGRVLECKMGYRAQFAYPKSFVNNGAISKRMSEVFGVELLTKSNQRFQGKGPRSPSPTRGTRRK